MLVCRVQGKDTRIELCRVQKKRKREREWYSQCMEPRAKCREQRNENETERNVQRMTTAAIQWREREKRWCSLTSSAASIDVRDRRWCACVYVWCAAAVTLLHTQSLEKLSSRHRFLATIPRFIFRTNKIIFKVLLSFAILKRKLFLAIAVIFWSICGFIFCNLEKEIERKWPVSTRQVVFCFLSSAKSVTSVHWNVCMAIDYCVVKFMKNGGKIGFVIGIWDRASYHWNRNETFI